MKKKKPKTKKVKLITAWLPIKLSNYNGCHIISILDLDIFDGEEKPGSCKQSNKQQKEIKLKLQGEFNPNGSLVK